MVDIHKSRRTVFIPNRRPRQITTTPAHPICVAGEESIEGWSENRIEMNLLLVSGSLGLNSISLGHVSIDPSFHGDQDDVSWTTALLQRIPRGRLSSSHSLSS